MNGLRERASPEIVIDHDQPFTKSGEAGSPSTKSGEAGLRSRNRTAKPAITITITITAAWSRHGSFCEESCELAAPNPYRLRGGERAAFARAWRAGGLRVRVRVNGRLASLRLCRL